MLVYKPKEDFQKTINFQGNYVELLKKLHEALTEKCSKSKGYEKAKNDVMIYELAVKLDAQIALFTEKLSHYQDIFIKPYNLELEECADKFEKVWAEALDYIDKNLESNTEVCKKIKSTTESFLSIDLKDKQHIEVKNVVYKDLKNLLKLVK
tara:strand:+ start:26 stop:481 length:456 start_codon:yes stop_codon:yes gene_type:complete